MISESYKNCFVLRFEGLSTKLSCVVRNGGEVIVIIHNDKEEDWDIVTEFDVHEHRSKNGQYFCSWCLEKKHYPSRMALWEEHIFEALLEWINDISFETIFCIRKYPGHSSWDVKFIKTKEDYKYVKDIDSCFPLVIEK